MTYRSCAIALGLLGVAAVTPPQTPVPDGQLFVQAASRDSRTADAALARIAAVWRDGYTAMLVDLARLMRPASAPVAIGPNAVPDADLRRESDSLGAAVARNPTAVVRSRLIRFLERQTGKRFGDDLWKWREWMWQLPYDPHPDYLRFKGELYGTIDPQFRAFFQPGSPISIRLDEIDWGGVRVNGIPPLDHPPVVPARDATHMADSQIVFGIEVNGTARAYPKRILAWHELARDRVGSVDLTVVYCTLCGTVIPYESRAGGVTRTFGTSGLLYRSNKLMFDAESMSLWSTLEGRPVVGALADSPIRLVARPVVTTTWGEWRREHPDTTVLTLDTGFTRDYSEGAAYREYFSHDRLMFAVPRADRRLRNKAEVVTLHARDEAGARRPVAIAADILRRRPVFHFQAGGRGFVVFTSPEGANRVYEAAGHTFTRVRASEVEDSTGRRWQLTESALVREDVRLRRVPAWRAFWFGWSAQFPETALHR